MGQVHAVFVYWRPGSSSHGNGLEQCLDFTFSNQGQVSKSVRQVDAPVALGGELRGAEPVVFTLHKDLLLCIPTQPAKKILHKELKLFIPTQQVILTLHKVLKLFIPTQQVVLTLHKDFILFLPTQQVVLTLHKVSLLSVTTQPVNIILE